MFLRRLGASITAVFFSVFVICLPGQAVAGVVVPINAVSAARVVGATGVATDLLAAGRVASALNPVVQVATIVASLCLLATGSYVCLSPSSAPVPTPTGWVDANTPPSTATVKTTWGDGYGGSFGDAMGAAISYEKHVYSTAQSVTDGGGCTFQSSVSATCKVAMVYNNGMASTVNVGVGASSACPSGYTLSSGSCVLSNPSAVMYPSTGNPNYKAGPNGWTADPRNPDSANSPVPANPVAQSGLDPNGSPAAQKVTPNPDGGIKWENWTQNTTNNQTTTVYNTFTTDNAGNVITNQTNAYYGSIPQAQAGTAPAATPSTAPVTIPTDYARDASVQQTNTKLDTIHQDLSADSAPDMADQQARLDEAKDTDKNNLDSLTNDIKSGYESDKNSWFSWVWTPSVGGGCSPFGGSVHGFAVQWDACATIAGIRDTIGWLFALFGAWDVYNQIFRRQE